MISLGKSTWCVLSSFQLNYILTRVQLYRTTKSDATKTPYVTVIASAQNVTKDDATFDLFPMQYTFLTRNSVATSQFPVHAIFDSPKYNGDKSRKPLPTTSSTVEAGGFLTRTLPDAKDMEKPDKFVMSVDHVNFLSTSAGSSDSQSKCIRLLFVTWTLILSLVEPRSKLGGKNKRKTFAAQLAQLGR